MILSPIQSIIAHHSRSCSVSLFLSQDRASATKSSPLGIPHFSRTKLGAVFLLNSAPDGFVIDQRGGKGNVLAVFIPMTVPFAFVQVYPALAFLPSRRWIDIDSRYVLGPCKRVSFAAFIALFGTLVFSTVDQETHLASTPVLALCRGGFCSFPRWMYILIIY
nr:uncharacterized protein LOC120963147 [Aegilops tauschii subsp. strangulata]